MNIYRHVTCKMACLSSLFGAILCGESGSVIVEEICRIGYNKSKRSRRQSNGSEAGYLLKTGRLEEAGFWTCAGAGRGQTGGKDLYFE